MVREEGREGGKKEGKEGGREGGRKGGREREKGTRQFIEELNVEVKSKSHSLSYVETETVKRVYVPKKGADNAIRRN